MPYNTTAIPPRKEVTGQTQLPRELHLISYRVAPRPLTVSCSHEGEEDHCHGPRHQHLLQQCCLCHHFGDGRSPLVSEPYRLTANTWLFEQEMFVQYLTGEAQNMMKLERKPRRNIQYKDMGKPSQHLVTYLGTDSDEATQRTLLPTTTTSNSSRTSSPRRAPTRRSGPRPPRRGPRSAARSPPERQRRAQTTGRPTACPTASGQSPS